MSKYITKEIPVSLHVKKFLEYSFGKQYTFSKNDFFGKLIISVFKKGFRKTQVMKCDSTYSVRILPHQLERIGNLIEWSEVVYINKGVDDIFREILFFHIDMVRKIENQNAFETMVQSLYEMRIGEGDISFDSIYRDYKRKCSYKKFNRKTIDFEVDL
ncbi:hypothetical protein [Aquimarina algiphila]|uniref:hypothetical protein n=1 Tax=Aquimarina algiphila TaxID=2047982 RepID=UPI00232BB74E|nr:hypothetical protein [Aquimarina algiphila]